jgi:hypothetical protein
MGMSSWTNLWIYLVADFAGAAVAAGAFKAVTQPNVKMLLDQAQGINRKSTRKLRDLPLARTGIRINRSSFGLSGRPIQRSYLDSLQARHEADQW